MPLYDFVCATGHKFEDLVPWTQKQSTCPICKVVAIRQLSCAHFDYLHMGLDPRGNPTAGDKWAKMHEDRAKQK